MPGYCLHTEECLAAWVFSKRQANTYQAVPWRVSSPDGGPSSSTPKWPCNSQVSAKQPLFTFWMQIEECRFSQVAIPGVRLTFNCSTPSCATSSDEEGGAWNAGGGNWWKQSIAISAWEMCSTCTLAGFDFRGPKIQQIWNYKIPGTTCHINWFLHLIIIDRTWIWKCWKQCNFATRPRPCLFYKGGCW